MASARTGTSRWRSSLAWSVLLAFILNAGIPSGFMPSGAGHGMGSLRLCDGHAHVNGQTRPSDHAKSDSSRCPFASAPGGALVHAVPVVVPAAVTIQIATPWQPTLPPRTSSERAHGARAPPARPVLAMRPA